MVRTTSPGRPYSRWMSRCTSRLNFCSVAPSSTSDLQRHRIVGCQQRIEQLVDGNRQVFFQARTKILALQHARQAVLPAEPNHLRTGKLAEPLAVVANFGFLAVEDLEHLFEIRLRVRIHLLARQRRPRFGLACGIADHGRKIADQKNCGVAHILKMFQLAQHNGVAQMYVRRRWIHAEIHAQRLSTLSRTSRAWPLALPRG